MNYKKSLDNQKITLKDCVIAQETYAPQPPKNDRVALLMVLIALVISVGIFITDHRKADPVKISLKPLVNCNASQCHIRVAMIRYFEKRKNPEPVKMTDGVLAVTKKHRTLAAAVVTKGEKNSPITARNTGYKRRHSGAYQVSEKDWGPVPKDAIGQSQQFEDIMTDLIRGFKNKSDALNQYGGCTTGKYAEKVMREELLVPWQK